jgi:3-deoxy-7-phosphoheptulonate synthase
MVIIFKAGTTSQIVAEILETLTSHNLSAFLIHDKTNMIIGVQGDHKIISQLLNDHPAIEKIKSISTSYQLVSRDAIPENTKVSVGKVVVGDKKVIVIGGPCAIESREQLFETATAVKEAGAHGLRGGAFKSRTSPYYFQGLGVAGLKLLHEVSQALDMPFVSEVIEADDVAVMARFATALQVGTRNMQNYRLLKELGRVKKPVLLKRGMSATIEEFLLAAEYIISEGNPNVILCERGIRTFEPTTRNTLDLAAVPYLKMHSHLPVIVDPSHGTGMSELVIPMSKAAIACGADGLLIEVHHHPKEALSDGRQSLNPQQFARLMNEIEPFVAAAGREL